MKKITIILGIVFVQLSLFAQIPTDSLVLYLPFNGNAVDESGNGHDGTVNGAILTEDRFGNPNSAYVFNGSSDYILVNNMPTNYTEYTFAGWIKGNTIELDDNGIILQTGIKESSSSHTSSFGISASSGDPFKYDGRHRIDTNANVPPVYLTSLDSNDLNWHLYVLTWNGNDLKFYKDGILENEATNITTASTILDELIIGACRVDDNIGYYFNGLVDDIRVYSRALSTCEIRALYFENEEANCSVYDTTYISVTDTLIIDAVLSGINPPNNTNTIKIYPNPAKTHIYINNGNYSLMNGYSIKIDNSLGQTVYNHLIDRQEFYINLSDWTGSGTYFVYIIDDNSNIIEVKKIILQ